jgi:hypothetical protein
MEERDWLENWRLIVTVKTPEKTWEQTYESYHDSITDWRFAAGFAAGFAHAHGIPAEQMTCRLEQWIDYDDGHSGGYPHWCHRMQDEEDQ